MKSFHWLGQRERKLQQNTILLGWIRQHCRLSICSFFGWHWQILNLRRAGLSRLTTTGYDLMRMNPTPMAWASSMQRLAPYLSASWRSFGKGATYSGYPVFLYFAFVLLISMTIDIQLQESPIPTAAATSVTKSVKWQYLGNQAWYQSSAGVKTTRNKIEIKNRK